MKFNLQIAVTCLRNFFGRAPKAFGAATTAIRIDSELRKVFASAWIAVAGDGHTPLVKTRPGSHPVTAKASQLLTLLRSMRVSGMRSLCVIAMLLGLNWFAGSARAGGSGLNTLVVINQNSSNSIALGNYFAERRNVPPENILRIGFGCSIRESQGR